VEQVIDAITYFVVFLFSTTLHEAAHAWAALRGGDLTAYHGGQVSLDPRPHIKREPFGMVILPLVSALATGWRWGTPARHTIRSGRSGIRAARRSWRSPVRARI